MSKCAYQYCGKEFESRPNKKFCSSNCRTYHSHGDTTVPGWQERARIANAPKSKIWVNTCPITNLPFIARNPGTRYHPSVRSLTYHEKTHVPAPKLKHTCIDCACTFEARNRQTPPQRCAVCSEREGRRVMRSQRRAKIRGVIKERVIPFEVFKRDGWTCQVCSKPTPRDQRGTLQHNSPEMDHIIPLAKGGVHSYANVQCLCRECNGEKAQKIEVKYIKKLFKHNVTC